MPRHDFTESTKRLLAERVHYRCSNPACGVPTIGPSINPNEKEYIGEAAHIYSASINKGPRANPSMSEEERRSIKNGIHLCSSCASRIDKNDGRGYPPEILYQWKRNAELIAGKGTPQKSIFNLYQLIEFNNLEKQYSTALTCSGLGEKNVLSCPSYLPYIQDISTKLQLAHKCIIKGETGCGKSLLTYQVAKKFYDEGWTVYKINKRSILDGIGIATPFQKSLILLDDSQTIDIAQLELMLQYSCEDCMILLNWNSSIASNSDFLSSYPCIDIVPSEQNKLLKQYCLKNKKHIASLLMKMGVKVSDRDYWDLIETRINRAAKEKTPWLFNYSLTEGWRTAENDTKLLKERGRLDLVLVIIALYQYATLDQGVDEDVIVNELRGYSSDSMWLEKAFGVLQEYSIKVDGYVRHKHYQYAKKVLRQFIESENIDSSHEYIICLLKRIMADDDYEKGHVDLLDLVFYDYSYCRHVLSNDCYFYKISKELFLHPFTSISLRIQKLNSLIHFDENVLSVIDDHINIIHDWIIECNKDSAYALRGLINTLINKKYRNLTISDEAIKVLFDKLLNASLPDKVRYSSLLNRMNFFFSEEQKDKFIQITKNSSMPIDISKYDIGKDHYCFSKVVAELSSVSDDWANECVHANLASIAHNLNQDLVSSLELYDELINHYFYVSHWILGIKIQNKSRKQIARQLAKMIKVDAILDSFKTLELSRMQRFYTFLIFLKIYNKSVLTEISRKIDYDHLKFIYKNDFELEHAHKCLIQLLHDTKSKPYMDYIDYVIAKNHEIIDLLVAMNPTKAIGELKKGKKFMMTIHDCSEYKYISTILNSLDSSGEGSLSSKIIRDNKEEIMKSIFSKSVNVDDKKEKYRFLVYLYKKSPDTLRDIFNCQEEVNKLFEKIRRLLRGKAIERNTAKLYVFFIRQFSQSHSEQIKTLEARFPSVKRHQPSIE